MALPMEDLKFRDFIANDGAAEEILRVLVTLIETKPADEMAFVLENLGQGTLPPFTSPTAWCSMARLAPG